MKLTKEVTREASFMDALRLCVGTLREYSDNEQVFDDETGESMSLGSIEAWLKVNKDRAVLTKDQVYAGICKDFHQTDIWFNKDWFNDVINFDLNDDDPNYVHDDNYSVRHDAIDATRSLVYHLYDEGYEIVKK